MSGIADAREPALAQGASVVVCDQGATGKDKFAQLCERVLGASDARACRAATREWNVVGCEENEERGGTCVCGHTHLRYLFRIHNRVTDRTPIPIGSVCIRQFGRADLDAEAKLLGQLIRLADGAARLGRGRVVGIKGGLFSRALIDHMHDEGAFGEDNRWGRNRDHERLRMLFGAHHIDEQREREATEIIRRCVYPYLREFWRRTRPGVTDDTATLGCA